MSMQNSSIKTSPAVLERVREKLEVSAEKKEVLKYIDSGEGLIQRENDAARYR
jgi:hypothetical protein